jgi:hypothetical protein
MIKSQVESKREFFYQSWGLVTGIYVPSNDNVRIGTILTDTGSYPAHVNIKIKTLVHEKILKNLLSGEEQVFSVWLRTFKNEPYLLYKIVSFTTQDKYLNSEVAHQQFIVSGQLISCRTRESARELIIKIRPNQNHLNSKFELKPFPIRLQDSSENQYTVGNNYRFLAQQEQMELKVIRVEGEYPSTEPSELRRHDRDRRKSSRSTVESNGRTSQETPLPSPKKTVWLDKKAAAEYLGVTTRTIDNYLKAGKISNRQSDGKFDQSLLEEWSAERAALKVTPSDAQTYLLRGKAHFRSENWHKAIAELDRAIDLAPDLAKAYVKRSLARLQIGEREAAIADLKMAASLFQQQGDDDNYWKAKWRLSTMEPVSQNIS